MADNLGRIQARRTPKGQERYELDFRKECRRLRIPERIGRINSIPSEAGPIVLESHKMAERALEAIRVRIAAGEPLRAVLGSFRPTGVYHVAKCAERWLAHQRQRAASGQLARSTIRKIETHIDAHFPRWAGVSVHEITYGSLEDWADELHGKGLHPSTVQAILSTMRSMMKWMRKRQELSDVPDFPAVSIPEHEPVLLTLEQQTAVLEEIQPEIRGIFLACADLWLRPSEARALAPSDYEPVKNPAPDDPAGWMTIRRAADGEGSSSPVREWTKTKRVRRLPVSDRLAEWIAEHRPPEFMLRLRFLFPSPHGNQQGMWSKSGMTSAWKRACRKSGVPAVKLNEGNRHSGATVAREALGEGQLTTVQKMLGHSDLRNTERYSRHKSGDLVKLVRKK